MVQHGRKKDERRDLCVSIPGFLLDEYFNNSSFVLMMGASLGVRKPLRLRTRSGYLGFGINMFDWFDLPILCAIDL